MALLLNRGLRGLSFYRAVYYLPSLLGGSVAVAVMWRQIFGADGLVNQVLALFGVTGPSWISNPEYALYTLCCCAVWQFGSPMVIFLAGLQADPAGAVRRGRGRRRRTGAAGSCAITIPLLTPMIFFNLILQMIGAFQAFTPALHRQRTARGGPVGLDAVLHALPLPAGLHQLPDGLRLGDGLGAAGHPGRRATALVVPDQPLLGPLRGSSPGERWPGRRCRPAPASRTGARSALHARRC